MRLDRPRLRFRNPAVPRSNTLLCPPENTQATQTTHRHTKATHETRQRSKLPRMHLKHLPKHAHLATSAIVDAAARTAVATRRSARFASLRTPRTFSPLAPPTCAQVPHVIRTVQNAGRTSDTVPVLARAYTSPGASAQRRSATESAADTEGARQRSHAHALRVRTTSSGHGQSPLCNSVTSSCFRTVSHIRPRAFFPNGMFKKAIASVTETWPMLRSFCAMAGMPELVA